LDENTCMWENHYQKLILEVNNLAGRLPPQLALLTDLILLGFRRNGRIGGTLPTEVGLLTNLVAVDLENKKLSGSVPTEIGRWTNLRSLRMHRNGTWSTIPSEVLQLSNLHETMMGQNQFSGSIPAGSSSLSLLKLELYENRLKGPLPTELGLVTALRVLELEDNQFTGRIPSELRLLHRLWNLRVETNQFSGPLPSELGQLKALENLRLDDNEQLIGTIPKEVGPLAISFVIAGNPSQSTGEGQSGIGGSSAASPQNGTFDPGMDLALLGPIAMDASNRTSMVVHSEQGANETKPGKGPGDGEEEGPPPPQPDMTNEELDVAVSLLSFEIRGTLISGRIPQDLCGLDGLQFDCSEMLCGCDCPCP
jgi:hypothetical protein